MEKCMQYNSLESGNRSEYSPLLLLLPFLPKWCWSQSVLLCSCEEDARKLRPIFKVTFPIFYFGAYVSQSKAKSAFTDSIAQAMLADLWWRYPHASAGWLCGGGPAGHASRCRSMPGVLFFSRHSGTASFSALLPVGRGLMFWGRIRPAPTCADGECQSSLTDAGE